MRLGFVLCTKLLYNESLLKEHIGLVRPSNKGGFTMNDKIPVHINYHFYI